MRVDRASGWLEGARWLPSPNHDERPAGTVVDLLVLHGISLPPEEFGGPWIDAFFTNRLNPDAHPYFQQIGGLRVSSHLLIRRSGEIVQYVSLQQRAWHAGRSAYADRANCNDFSIGIELEGASAIPYTPAQYESLVEVIRALRTAYPAITQDRIVGHADIAPGRKTDPWAAFDWRWLMSSLGKTE